MMFFVDKTVFPRLEMNYFTDTTTADRQTRTTNLVTGRDPADGHL